MTYWGLLDDVESVETFDPVDEEPVAKVLTKLERERRRRRKAVLEDVLEWSKDWEPVPGIYFLISGEEVVYIGKSRDMHKRVGEHNADGKIEFDRVAMVEVEDRENRNWMERNFLEWLKPEHNSRWRP